MAKIDRSYRFKPETMAALHALEADLGLNQTATVEMAIREFARARGLAVPPAAPAAPKRTAKRTTKRPPPR